MRLPSHTSICPSQLKYQMKFFWLKASVLYEQLLNSVPYAMSHIFFFKLDKFQPLKLFLEILVYQPT